MGCLFGISCHACLSLHSCKKRASIDYPLGMPHYGGEDENFVHHISSYLRFLNENFHLKLSA